MSKHCSVPEGLITVHVYVADLFESDTADG